MTLWLRTSLVALATLTVSSAVPCFAGPSTQQQMSDGSDLFRSYCKACHGDGAKGDGPLASALKKRPADLTGLAARNGGTFPTEMVARIIDGRNPVTGHGGGDMPVWGDALLRSQVGGTEALVSERISAIVSYLRTLQK